MKNQTRRKPLDTLARLLLVPLLLLGQSELRAGVAIPNRQQAGTQSKSSFDVVEGTGAINDVRQRVGPRNDRAGYG